MPDPGPSDDAASGHGRDEGRHQEPDIGPIDYDICDRIADYLRGSARYAAIEVQPRYAPNAIVADYDLGYFPPGVQRAYLQIRWYVTDDFTVHYAEQYRESADWECRWDRHPNDHNTRAHFHPPPTAATPGDDADFPREWRDVMTLIMRELDARVESFWDEK